MQQRMAMYDSAGGIFPTNPAHPFCLLVPVNGIYATLPNGRTQLEEAQDLFPGVWCVQYSVTRQKGVAVYDVEPGAVWPPSVAATVANLEVQEGRRPTLYASKSVMQELTGELAIYDLAIGVDHRVDGLLADPLQFADNPQAPANLVVPFPYVGVQWSWGYNYDTSLVLGTWDALKPRGGSNQP